VVVKKYHFSDACMSLGSALLKRAYIVKCTGLEWSRINLGRRLDDPLGKPCWIQADDGLQWPIIDFNVSHQRGIVVFVGACTRVERGAIKPPEVEIAVDVVSPNERNDMAIIAGSNFADFVSTFEYVLSEEESFALTYSLPTDGSIQLLSGEEISNQSLGRFDRTTECGQTFTMKLDQGRSASLPSEIIIEEKLRNFYATFSLKEAYTKLGGLGLTAPWIKQLEFMGTRAPQKGGVRRCNILGTWGEVIKGDKIEMRMHGELVHDVVREQQALEEDYIITTMLKPARALDEAGFPAWINVHLDEILPRV
jgi:4'-phosphopantetheinyl transferase